MPDVSTNLNQASLSLEATCTTHVESCKPLEVFGKLAKNACCLFNSILNMDDGEGW